LELEHSLHLLGNGHMSYAEEDSCDNTADAAQRLFSPLDVRVCASTTQDRTELDRSFCILPEMSLPKYYRNPLAKRVRSETGL